MSVTAEQPHPSSHAFTPPPGGMAELPLLLPAGQAVQLEQAAWRRGLTVGQMLRWAVQALLEADREAPAVASESLARLADTMVPP